MHEDFNCSTRVTKNGMKNVLTANVILTHTPKFKDHFGLALFKCMSPFIVPTTKADFKILALTIVKRYSNLGIMQRESWGIYIIPIKAPSEKCDPKLGLLM